MNHVLTADNLTLHYDKAPVLWDVSLKVKPGKIVGIVGPNGAGKSSFLKAAIGHLKPVSGRILFWNQTVYKVYDKISYIPQKEEIDWDFPITVYEVALMGRYHKMGFFKRPRKADHEATIEALEMVGMLEFKDRQISELSGGQKQKLFIARALSSKAELYLMDEPFQCVDISTERAIMQILKELKNQGKSIFIVHHDLKTAAEYFDEVILLNTSLVCYGNVKDVLIEKNLKRAYAYSHELFEEAKVITKKKEKGLI